MNTDWITTAAAAGLSGYHPVYLMELLRAGRIKGQKFGPVWQVSRASLLAFMRAAEDSPDGRRGARKRRR